MERHKRMKTAKSSFTKMVITYIVVITIVVSSTSLVWATDNEASSQLNDHYSSNEAVFEAEGGDQVIGEAITKPDENCGSVPGNDRPSYGEIIVANGFTNEADGCEADSSFAEGDGLSEEGSSEGLDMASEPHDVGASDVTGGPCGSEGADVRWDFKDGVLTISGNGDMKRDSSPAWKELGTAIKEVIVTEGVTRIGWSSFMSLYGLEKVTIAGSVKRIEEFAFANDKAIKEINLGEGIETILGNAFYYAGVESLKLPASLKKLDYNALNGLYSLKEYQIGDGESIYQVKDGILFKDDFKTLVSFPEARTGSFTVPDGVTTINDDAFIYSNLQEVIMPDTVTTLVGSVFWYANVEKVVLSAGLETLPDSVFFCNHKLKSITIKEGVKSINNTAFYGCENLKSVKIPSSIEYISNSAFNPQPELVFTGKELYKTDGGTYLDPAFIKVNGEDNYTYSFEVLDIVNSQREANGLPALKMEKTLLDTAMLRASELGINFSHTRPLDETCFGANKIMTAENIGIGYKTPESAMAAWMDSYYHKENILNQDNKYIGIGCVKISGVYCWVQCFSSYEGEETQKEQYKDEPSSRMILVRKKENLLSPTIKVISSPVIRGSSSQIYLIFESRVGLQSTGAVLESSDPEVCSVEGDVLKGNKTGEAEITAYFPGFEKWKQSANVNVVVPVTGVKLNQKSMSLKVGCSEKLKATMAPSDASDKSVVWSSSKTNVATVDGDGNVKAISSGMTNITVITADKKYRATCTVYVQTPVQSVEFKTSSLIIEPGVFYRIEPSFTPSNASNLNVTWSGSNDEVVYVSQNGNIYGRRPGKSIVTITTEDGGKTASCTVMVTFYDVQDSSGYYYDSVYWAVESDITSGYGEGTFQPMAKLSRAQTVMFLYKMAGSPEVNGLNVPDFKDVPKDAWYYNAVKWAVANNITSGYGEGTFQPNVSCNRAMIVAFLMRYSKLAGTYVAPTEASTFKDVSSDAWYREAVDWAVANGVTSGYGEGMFQPMTTCNRAMMVTFLKRTAELPSIS